ncbi:hypothetical protein BXU01_03875 [[Flexibacter] sp. ATCC 35103]|nr:hypothetical protein BXU01_03875 [[Flexibacter] sp. ATCC 35103]
MRLCEINFTYKKTSENPFNPLNLWAKNKNVSQIWQIEQIFSIKFYTKTSENQFNPLNLWAKSLNLCYFEPLPLFLTH